MAHPLKELKILRRACVTYAVCAVPTGCVAFAQTYHTRVRYEYDLTRCVVVGGPRSLFVGLAAGLMFPLTWWFWEARSGYLRTWIKPSTARLSQ